MRGYLPLRAFRGVVVGVLAALGSVFGLAGAVSLAVFLALGGVGFLMFGTVFLGLWYAAFWLRCRYDRALLRRVPPGETLFLPQ